MSRKMFVNLPVKNLQRSIDFFTSLGFSFNPLFTDETATCMVIGEENFVMLLDEKKFSQFTKKNIADATKNTEVLVALSCESRDEVNDLVSKAKAAGGKSPMPANDMGFMYQHGFEDPDGHMWEVFYMSEMPSTN